MSFHLCFRLPEGYRINFSDGSQVDFEASDPEEALEKALAIADERLRARTGQEVSNCLT